MLGEFRLSISQNSDESQSEEQLHRPFMQTDQSMNEKAVHTIPVTADDIMGL